MGKSGLLTRYIEKSKLGKHIPELRGRFWGGCFFSGNVLIMKLIIYPCLTMQTTLYGERIYLSPFLICYYTL